MNTTAAALDQSAASPAQLDDSCCGGVGARGIIARSATRRKAVELGQPSWFTPPLLPPHVADDFLSAYSVVRASDSLLEVYVCLLGFFVIVVV